MNEYIIEDEKGFYYIDETSNLIGPFNTWEQADIALEASLKWEAKDHQPRIRKMKENMGI